MAAGAPVAGGEGEAGGAVGSGMLGAGELAAAAAPDSRTAVRWGTLLASSDRSLSALRERGVPYGPQLASETLARTRWGRPSAARVAPATLSALEPEDPALASLDAILDDIAETVDRNWAGR